MEYKELYQCAPEYEIKIKALKEMKAYLPVQANSAKEAIAAARKVLDDGEVFDHLDWESCYLYGDNIKITAAYQPEADDNCENDSVGLEAKEVHWPLD